MVSAYFILFVSKREYKLWWFWSTVIPMLIWICPKKAVPHWNLSVLKHTWYLLILYIKYLIHMWCLVLNMKIKPWSYFRTYSFACICSVSSTWFLCILNILMVCDFNVMFPLLGLVRISSLINKNRILVHVVYYTLYFLWEKWKYCNPCSRKKCFFIKIVNTNVANLLSPDHREVINK